MLSPTHIVLAPMEGVIDAAMRQRLTHDGAFDRCVTEFVRVTNVRLPERVFLRLCPELSVGGRTASGTPVYVQLLGSDPVALADNAARAARLGALGVDLNFGCPAKTVNNSMGGSVLLQYPERVTGIVQAVRDAVPAQVPVTVKIRLGYEHADDLVSLVNGIRTAGADELAIHARTKSDGYRPPAHWQRVGALTDAGVSLPPAWLTINGEIWSAADADQAMRQSGCDRIMLGRGALADPGLASRLRTGSSSLTPWSELVDAVQVQFNTHDSASPRHVGNRTKQWLAYLRRNYAQAELLFQRLRRLHDIPTINAAFEEHRYADLERAPRTRSGA